MKGRQALANNGFGDKYGNQRIIESVMQQQPQMAMMTPMNDIQVIGLMASQRTDVSAEDAVKWASEVMIEAARQMKAIGNKIREELQKG